MIKCGRPPKGKESVSRDRLLDCALDLFLNKGYEHLNMETIARDARVSLRTIYSHFGSKAGLFGAVIKRCSDQFVGSLQQQCDPAKGLVAFAIEYVRLITRPDSVRIRTILIAESQRFPELAAEFYEQGPARALENLSRFFSAQQREGFFADIDATELADQFLSCLRKDRYQKLLLGLEPTPADDEIERWARQTVELFLQGCLNKPSATPSVEA